MKTYSYPEDFGDMGDYLSEFDYDNMRYWAAMGDWYAEAVASGYAGSYDDYIREQQARCELVENPTETGYRLHIEGDDCEATAYQNMADVRAEQRRMAKEFGRTYAEIDAISYIVTEAEYQAERLECWSWN